MSHQGGAGGVTNGTGALPLALETRTSCDCAGTAAPIAVGRRGAAACRPRDEQESSTADQDGKPTPFQPARSLAHGTRTDAARVYPVRLTLDTTDGFVVEMSIKQFFAGFMHYFQVLLPSVFPRALANVRNRLSSAQIGVVWSDAQAKGLPAWRLVR